MSTEPPIKERQHLSGPRSFRNIGISAVLLILLLVVVAALLIGMYGLVSTSALGNGSRDHTPPATVEKEPDSIHYSIAPPKGWSYSNNLYIRSDSTTGIVNGPVGDAAIRPK